MIILCLTKEAGKRLEKYGLNEIRATSKTTPLKILFRQIRTISNWSMPLTTTFFPSPLCTAQLHQFSHPTLQNNLQWLYSHESIILGSLVLRSSYRAKNRLIPVLRYDSKYYNGSNHRAPVYASITTACF